MERITQPLLPPVYNSSSSIFLEDNFSEEQRKILADFAEAGFDIKAELRRRDLLKSRLKNRSDNLADYYWWFSLTDQVMEHAFEYSRKDIVRFPPSYLLVDGRLFSPRFSAFAQDLVDSRERGGSVLAGLQKVESLLKEEENSLVVWVSPAGPLGIGDLAYDYSWTHVFWSEEQENQRVVNYVSLRTDFTLAEHQRFLNFFLPVSQALDQNLNGLPGIRQVLETPVGITPQQLNGLKGKAGLKAIVELLSLIRGNLGFVAYQDKTDQKIRYFNEMLQEIEVLALKQFNEQEQLKPIIDFYRRQILEPGLSFWQQARLIGDYLMAIHQAVRLGLTQKLEDPIKLTNESNFASFLAWIAYNQNLLADLKKTVGCAALLKQNTTTFTSYQSFLGETASAFICPECGFTTWERVGNKCPSCGLTKEAYARKLGPGEKTCD